MCPLYMTSHPRDWYPHRCSAALMLSTVTYIERVAWALSNGRFLCTMVGKPQTEVETPMGTRGTYQQAPLPERCAAVEMLRRSKLMFENEDVRRPRNGWVTYLCKGRGIALLAHARRHLGAREKQ